MGKPAHPKWKSLRYSKDANEYLWWVAWKLRGIATQMGGGTYGHGKVIELANHISGELIECDRFRIFNERLCAVEREVEQLKRKQ